MQEREGREGREEVAGASPMTAVPSCYSQRERYEAIARAPSRAADPWRDGGLVASAPSRKRNMCNAHRHCLTKHRSSHDLTGLDRLALTCLDLP